MCLLALVPDWSRASTLPVTTDRCCTVPRGAQTPHQRRNSVTAWHSSHRLLSVFRLKLLASALAFHAPLPQISFLVSVSIPTRPRLYPHRRRPAPTFPTFQHSECHRCSHYTSAHHAAGIIASRIGRCPAPDVVRVSLLPSTVHRAGWIPRARGLSSV